ncbi:MAG: PDZ domain-containing protein [Bacteroidota bacterium]
MPTRLLLLVLLLAAVAPLAAAQDGTRLLREPTLSADHVAFVYADDLWIASRDGGDARRLTSDEGSESAPHFSPDGDWIAFSAEYDGNTDVYRIPAEGGVPQRLTYHPGADIVQGWTPDGERVLFRSGRQGHPTELSTFYTVAAVLEEDRWPEPLGVPRAAQGDLSADGRFVAYEPITYWDPEWRNYRGGQALPIWIVDLDDLSLQRTPRVNDERHLRPVWLDGTLYYLSERDFASNVWSYDPTTGAERQLTFHTEYDVKSLDAGPDALVYEQGGYLHLLDPATGTSETLTIHARGDLDSIRPRWEEVEARALTNASLSPTGQRALFEHRGDLFTVPKEHGPWRNLTETPGEAERAPAWSPDGTQIAYFSDFSGEYRLVVTDQYGTETLRSVELPEPTYYFRPAWSPDGDHIAFTDTDYQLWLVDLESGDAQVIDTDGYAHPNRTMNPVWAPGGRYLAYPRLLDTQFKQIRVYDTETQQHIDITNGFADAVTPVWDAGGEYLYLLASTDYGLNTGWLDMSSYDRPITRALYVVALAEDTPSPFLPRSDDEPEPAEDEETDEEEDGESDEEEEPLQIDPDGLDRRIMAVPNLPSRNFVGLVAGPEGHVFVLESVPNQPGLTVHRYSLDDREAMRFMGGVQGFVTSHDRAQALYRQGGTWGIVAAAGGPPEAGAGALALGDLRQRVDPVAEWQQIFREGWRLQRDFLYVDNMHGAPWDEVFTWYKPWVDHVRHRTDLNYLLDMMGGEIGVGHSYVGGGDQPDVDRVPVGLLGADFTIQEGHYQIERIYTGEAWNPGLTAPLAVPGLDVAEGDYLMAVNDTPLSAADNVYSLLEATAGRQIVLHVNDEPTMEGARRLTVVPVANEGGLRTYAWVEDNRRRVEERSDGRLAYVWLPNTAGGGYNFFNRYYFAQQDRAGAVIDQRNNGGGSAADYIADVLARDLHGYFNSKAGDRRPFTTPMAGLWGPKVMIINERAGSGGDLLPYLFRKMEIGPLVGTRTWGGLVGTWDTPRFVDGGFMIAPRGGFFDVDGEWAVEGVGVAPDIEVIQTPADVMAGRDPQLDRAIDEALRLLDTERVVLQDEPAAPLRYRRPATSSDASEGGEE